MLCQAGVEWNFAYVLPGEEKDEKILLVSISLQMGWVLSPAYLRTYKETETDYAQHYINDPVGTLPPHPL